MEGDRQHLAHPGGPDEQASVDRSLLRIRDVREGAHRKGAPAVLLIAADRPFRDVVALLLERRGCAVSTTVSIGGLAERVERERPDVAVIDVGGSPAWATRAAVAVAALEPALGIVMVEEGEGRAADAGDVRLSKWSSFQLLFEAVERAAKEAASPAGSTVL
jgi:ActR/RegA family two-component response regulator